MNDNLPDINFKEKKEKKKGITGWLRSRLGLGSRGAMGEAGINPSAMNVGRALGAGNFGTSSGIAGLLAGKAGLLATIAAVAVASGVYLANQAPAPTVGTSAFSGGKVQDNYVPAILRSQAANQGSSLDMFKETNKNTGLTVEDNPSAKPSKQADEKPVNTDEQAAQDQGNQPAPDQGNMAQAMMGKLQGGDIGSLTSSMGGGSNKFSGMGGFSNKFNQGAMGAKTGFSAGIGSGFQAMPKFDARKGQLASMKGTSRPVFDKAGAGKKGKFGAGAFGQAKGLRATQKSYYGRNADQMAGTQNQAWTGSTAQGDTSGSGAGLSDGGAGVMTSPSLDNAGSSGGGGGANTPDATVPSAPGPEDVSPWRNVLTMVMVMVLLSCVLAWVASQIQLWWVRWIVAAIALICALAAIMMAVQLMSKYGQKMLGVVYMLGGVMAAIASVRAFGGSDDTAPGTEKVAWLAIAGGAIAMIGSMLGGK